MNSTPFMQLYVADYLADTQHLTTEQHGAYLLLLMTMWRNAGSLPKDEKKLARIAHVSLKRWHIIAKDLMEFFDIEGDIITQKRLVEEFKKAVSKSEKRKISGSLGGRAKSLKNNTTSLANASEELKHLSDIRTIKKDTYVSPKKACRLPDTFQPDFSFARKQGLTDQEVQNEFDSFRDYWNAKSGKDAAKLDWQATWRNWIRTSKRYRENKHASTANETKSIGRRFSEAVFDSCNRQGLDPFKPIIGSTVPTNFQNWHETNQRPDNEDPYDARGSTKLTLITNNAR